MFTWAKYTRQCTAQLSCKRSKSAWENSVLHSYTPYVGCVEIISSTLRYYSGMCSCTSTNFATGHHQWSIKQFLFSKAKSLVRTFNGLTLSCLSRSPYMQSPSTLCHPKNTWSPSMPLTPSTPSLASGPSTPSSDPLSIILASWRHQARLLKSDFHIFSLPHRVHIILTLFFCPWVNCVNCHCCHRHLGLHFRPHLCVFLRLQHPGAVPTCPLSSALPLTVPRPPS